MGREAASPSHPARTKQAIAEPYGEFKQDYPSELCVPGTDVIGYIEIPAIDARLPIYRYSSDESMSRGCGHSECTSLPVGGADSHTVLLSHRNMATAVTLDTCTPSISNTHLLFVRGVRID